VTNGTDLSSNGWKGRHSVYGLLPFCKALSRR
jgi:hypothetical protein